MEGISALLGYSELTQLVRQIQPDVFILDFLKHDMEISPARRNIPHRIYEEIWEYLERKQPCRHSYESLQDIIPGYVWIEKHSLRRMEKSMHGANTYFPTDASGWVELGVMKRSSSHMKHDKSW